MKPSPHKPYLASTALMVLLMAYLPNAHANKKEASKQNLTDVQQRLEALKKELDDSQEAHKDAADALKESEQAISQAKKKLFEISQKQQQNNKTLSQLKSASMSTQQALKQQQQQLSAQLYQQYMHGQKSYIQMILQSESPNEIARDVQYFSYVVKARAALIKQMQDNLYKISQLNDKTASALKEVMDLKQKQMEEKRALEDKKLEKSKVLKSLSEQITAQRDEIKKLTRDEKRLSDLVARLAKIIPPPSKKLRSKRLPDSNSNAIESAENKKAPKEVLSNSQEPGQAVSGVNFAALRGKLRLPVRGDVTNRFGESREDSGISWKGLFIKANEGAEVKSIATGRVVFADWLRGFGNLIILDHGDGYMSLYGNNQAVLKQVGDNVNAGDVIASVGNSGGNESNGLYYELRSQSRPFDPLSWSRLN